MAVKHLILVHGRDIKPGEQAMFDLAGRAIRSGLQRAQRADALDLLNGGKIKISFAYYGDISNALLVRSDRHVLEKLKDTDPEHENSPCFPKADLDIAFGLSDAPRPFDAPAYRKVLADNKDHRFRDELADAVSYFGSLFTGGALNTFAINMATADLGAYLTSHSIGSAIRERLSGTLRQAMANGDDICLLTHSMGCMVAYDVLWKYSHMSEYEGFRALKAQIALWLTIGNPLAEDGVRRNLLDGRYPDKIDQFPRGQVREWANFFAEDDFVARAEKVAGRFKTMKDEGGALSITDTHVYNCWIYEDARTGDRTSNPHDFYGYLMNQKVADRLAQWVIN